MLQNQVKICNNAGSYLDPLNSVYIFLIYLFIYTHNVIIFLSVAAFQVAGFSDQNFVCISCKYKL
jgi:hypothetical protein